MLLPVVTMKLVTSYLLQQHPFAANIQSGNNADMAGFAAHAPKWIAKSETHPTAAVRLRLPVARMMLVMSAATTVAPSLRISATRWASTLHQAGHALPQAWT